MLGLYLEYSTKTGHEFLKQPVNSRKLPTCGEDSSIWDDTDSQRRISHTLSTKLHPDLLRGVPLHLGFLEAEQRKSQL